jgi:hypothetical protein
MRIDITDSCMSRVLRSSCASPLCRRCELHRVEHRGGLRQHGLGDHQFADQVDQLVHLGDVDANRGLGGAAARRGAAVAALAVAPFDGGWRDGEGGGRAVGCRSRRWRHGGVGRWRRKVDKKAVGVVHRHGGLWRAWGRGGRVLEQAPGGVGSGYRGRRCGRCVVEETPGIAILWFGGRGIIKEAVTVVAGRVVADPYAVAAGDELDHAAQHRRVGLGGDFDAPGAGSVAGPCHHARRPLGRNLVDQGSYRGCGGVGVAFVKGEADRDICADGGVGRRFAVLRRGIARCIVGQGGQARAGVADPCRIGGLASAMGRQQVLEQVAGIEEGIDHGGAQGQFALADAIEKVFQHMRDFGQVGETEGSRRALDRMRGAEDGVELFRVRVLDIEIQQQRFHAGEVLLGLLEEDLIELTEID